MAVGRSNGSIRRWPRSRSSPTDGCAAPGRCSTRSPPRCAAIGRTSSLQCGAARARPAHVRSAQRHSRHALRDAAGRVLRDAAGRPAAGKTDEDFVLGAAARHGRAGGLRIGFRLRPGRRHVPRGFLPRPEELSRIYDDIADFTGRLSRLGLSHAAAPKVSRRRSFSLPPRGASACAIARIRPETRPCARRTPVRSSVARTLICFRGTWTCPPRSPRPVPDPPGPGAPCTGLHPDAAIRQRRHHRFLPRAGARRRADLRRRHLLGRDVEGNPLLSG